MACKPVCRLCDKIRISSAVNLVDGNIVIDIPAGYYNNCQKICLIIAQNIPTTAPISANVFISIGGGTVQYPLLTRNCRPVNVCGIRTRTKYSMCVETTATSGVFKLLGNACPCPTNNLTSINGTAPAASSPTTDTTTTT